MDKPKHVVSDGSISKYQVKSGIRWRWQAVASIQEGQKRKYARRIGAAGFMTRREARDDMSETLYLVVRNGLPTRESVVEPDVSFLAVSGRWLLTLDLANSTLAGNRKILRNHLHPYLGHLAIPDITTEVLNALYVTLSASGRKDSKQFGGSLKANTVNKCHQLVRAILDFAVLHKIMRSNVARSQLLVVPSVRSMRAQKTEIEVWTMEETEAVLHWNELVDQDDLHTLWRLYAFSGLRRGEGIALRWKDIDFVNSTLKIVRATDPAKSRAVKSTKTYRQRSIDLDPDTLGYLEAYRGQRGQLGPEYVQPSSYVFGTIENELRGPNDVTRRFSKMVRRAQEALAGGQLPWVTLQGLRHGHATHLLEAGVQPKVVQERLGHSNIQTTMDIYSHVMPTIQRDALGLLMMKWPRKR